MDLSLLGAHELCRVLVDDARYGSRPPVICNSIPKSGTHLLLQIASAMPGARHWGNFIASTPSLTLKERDEDFHLAKLRGVLPGEILGAHIYYSSGRAAAMRERNVCHLFIYRDPRDVVVSEAHYLTEMNRWHRLHRELRSLPTFEDRLLLLIDGIEGVYPNIAERIKRYSPWIADPDTLAIRFERLMGEERESSISAVVRHYLRHSDVTANEGQLVERALEHIAPMNSHTFRRAGIGEWQSAFTDRVRQRFEEVAGDMPELLGYA